MAGEELKARDGLQVPLHLAASAGKRRREATGKREICSHGKKCFMHEFNRFLRCISSQYKKRQFLKYKTLLRGAERAFL